MVKQNSTSSSSSSSSISKDFFSGKIRDRTTKQSRKAADDLALIRSKQKNPQWQPVNAKVTDDLRFHKRNSCTAADYMQPREER